MSDYLAVTHDVQNQPRPLENYNLYGGDLALMEGVARRGAGWAANDLADFGAASGTAEMLELGHLANKFAPEFDSHDRFGHRVDLVRFHPSYHQLMSRAIGHGLHSSPAPMSPAPRAFICNRR
jgi:putative acyl-CoA dehydrogenase